MHTRSIMKFVLAGALAVASMSPALAAKRHAHHAPKVINACAQPTLRCVSDCDKDHWCHIYACSGNVTIVLPFTCAEDSGLCFAPHC